MILPLKEHSRRGNGMCKVAGATLGYVESMQKFSVAGAFAVQRVLMENKVRQGGREQTLESLPCSRVLLSLLATRNWNV